MIERGNKVRILGEPGSTWTVMSVKPLTLSSDPPIRMYELGLQGPGVCRGYRTVRIEQVELVR